MLETGNSVACLPHCLVPAAVAYGEPVQRANPAYERLLQDYTDYHFALVVVGGVFTLALLRFAVFSWVRFSRTARGPERRTHLVFSIVSSTVVLLFGVVLAGNLSNVLNPQQGLASTIGTPGDLGPAASTELTRSLNAWVRSDSAEVPALIQDRVDARLAWQEPKAVISVVLLVALVALSVLVWRRVIAKWRTGTRAGFARVFAGSLAMFACFVLMLMVMGNVQASYAPIVMTLVFG
jgi:hypothetical protein